MKADQLRSQNDRELFERLSQDRTVKRTREHVERQAEKEPPGVRRHLLASAVRLSQSMAPQVHRMAQHCKEALGVETEVELYVFPSATLNAACVKPEQGRVFVMFSSSLLEGFDDKELTFVMGHELGHHVYQHHDIPIGYILRGDAQPPASLALSLSTWSRYAEISADRAGAFCTENLEAVARSLFKLASGVCGSVIEFDLNDFLRQVDEMQLEGGEPGQGAPSEDWFLTHPFSPLRVKALKLFDESSLQRSGGHSAADLEVAVQGLMSLMEPSYLEGRTEAAELMRRLLFAGCLSVADASGDISDEEFEVFESFFPNTSRDRVDVDRLKKSVPERAAQALKLCSLPQRMQVLRDLCTIARAEGNTGEAEFAVLLEIAEGLEVPSFFVRRTLDESTTLD